MTDLLLQLFSTRGRGEKESARPSEPARRIDFILQIESRMWQL